jgi:hypothetical protein
MARNLHADFKTEIAATTKQPILLFDLEFTSGTVYMWNGLGDLSYGGNTYSGTGHLLGVSQVTETADVQANGIKMTLSGIPSSLISSVLSDIATGDDAIVRLAFLDSSGSIVSDPYILFQGTMDVPIINEAADTSTIEISAESRLIDLKKPRIRRYTKGDQVQEYSGDVFFEFVPSLQNKDITWGR